MFNFAFILLAVYSQASLSATQARNAYWYEWHTSSWHKSNANERHNDGKLFATFYCIFVWGEN